MTRARAIEAQILVARVCVFHDDRGEKSHESRIQPEVLGSIVWGAFVGLVRAELGKTDRARPTKRSSKASIAFGRQFVAEMKGIGRFFLARTRNERSFQA